MGVHGRAFMRVFIHACATLLLSLDTRHSSFCPQHELLLLLSLARAAPSLFLNAWRRPLHPSLQLLRLVLETRGSSPGPQHESSRAFMSRAAPLPRVLRAIYRLAPVTCPARARARFARCWRRQVMLQLNRVQPTPPCPALFAAAPAGDRLRLASTAASAGRCSSGPALLVAAPAGDWLTSTAARRRSGPALSNAAASGPCNGSP
jgi:hypothetical protein